MGDVWTIRRVIAWTVEDFRKRGFDSARLEADLLVAKALGVERISLYLDLDRPLTNEELRGIRELVARRRAHEPIAYILGRREFYGRNFHVTPDVLIPRPDTETLVEQALAFARDAPDGPIVDLCTGSGAVVVTLCLELPQRHGLATDLSAAALEVACHNAQAHGVAGRIEWRQGDGLLPLGGTDPVALMVVNPPYIRSADIDALEPDVRDYEPRVALDGGPDGLAFYRRLATSAAPHLRSSGRLLMEVGYDQADEVCALFRQGWTDHRIHDDLAGTPRVVSVRATGESG